MLTFRRLLFAIAGLWLLSSLQHAVHPRRYPHPVSPLSSPAALSLGVAQAHASSADGSAPQLWPLSLALLPAVFALLVPRAARIPAPTARLRGGLPLYRLFPTGLSPPLHARFR